VEQRRQLIAKTVRELRKPVRAVSVADFEALATAADERVARVHCIPGKTEGRIRIIVVPDPEKNPKWDLSDELKEKVHRQLQDCCPLTTQLDVEGPKLARVNVKLKLVLEDGALEEGARLHAKRIVKKFLDPLKWPFGEPVYASKLTELFADLPGIREIKDISLSVNTGKPDIEIDIKPDELAIAQDPIDICIEEGRT
jgi:hypothetical protein